MKREGYILLTVTFFEEDDQWVGLCQELGTATCADTLDEAHEALEEAIFMQLNALEELGERPRFFEKHGIRLYRTKPSRKKFSVSASLEREDLSGKKLVPVPVHV